MERGGGIVVCGGESRRMGQSKAWLPAGDETLLQRVVRTMQRVTDPVVVVAAQGQELPQLPAEVAVVRDARPNCGPMEGIRVGLAELSGKVDWAFVTSCDVPNLLPEFVQAVASRLGEADVAVPVDTEFAHCLAAVYRTSLAKTLDQLLEDGIRRPIAVFDRVETNRIAVDDLRQADPELASLRNVNTPQAYAEFLEREGLC